MSVIKGNNNCNPVNLLKLYLMEKIDSLNYPTIIGFIADQKQKREVGMTKSELKQLLTIAITKK